MLRELLEKTKFDYNDSLKKTFGKAIVEGAIDGLVIVGALTLIENLLKRTKK